MDGKSGPTRFGTMCSSIIGNTQKQVFEGTRPSKGNPPLHRKDVICVELLGSSADATPKQ
jgi:hypothetical protein